MGNNINPNKDNSDNYYLSNFGITKEQYDLSTNSIQDDAKKLSPYWNTPLKDGQEASDVHPMWKLAPRSAYKRA